MPCACVWSTPRKSVMSRSSSVPPPTAGMSLLEHRKNGYLDREVMRAAIPLGTLAALAAAWAATSVDITVFRKPFGVFLLWAGANMLLQKKK